MTIEKDEKDTNQNKETGLSQDSYSDGILVEESNTISTVGATNDEEEAEEMVEKEPQIVFYVKTVKATNVRETPNKNGNLLRKIHNAGVQVDALDSVTGDDGKTWYKLLLDNGMIGYARSDFFGEPIYVDAIKNEQSEEENVSILFYATTKKETNVRDKAKKKGKLLAKLSKPGTEVAVLEILTGDDGKDWFRVRLADGTIGYARYDFFNDTYDYSSDSDRSPEASSTTAESDATSVSLPQVFVVPGNTIIIGRYEQDGNLNNGTEVIEWTVLDVQGRNCLLLSKYGLDVVPYHSEKKAITWETCSLRAWLNNDFLYTAFTPEERAGILLTNVDNGRSQRYTQWNAEGGNNTQDYLYLLSYAEAANYFNLRNDPNTDNVQAKCAPTVYAIQKGAYIPPEVTVGTLEGKRAGSWWLRSPGSKKSTAAGVGGRGNLGYDNVNTRDNAVRPCFWLDLDSDIINNLLIFEH